MTTIYSKKMRPQQQIIDPLDCQLGFGIRELRITLSETKGIGNTKELPNMQTDL